MPQASDGACCKKTKAVALELKTSAKFNLYPDREVEFWSYSNRQGQIKNLGEVCLKGMTMTAFNLQVDKGKNEEINFKSEFCDVQMEIDGGFKNLDFQLIQRELSARNLYDGAIDGIMGPKACKGFLLYLKYILRKTENTYTKKDHYRTRTYLMGSRKRENGNFFLEASFGELPQNERVKIQEKLSQLNFYTLTIDGLFGAGTEKAIEKYSQNFFKEKTYNEMEKASLLLQHIIEASCYSNATICSDDEICTQATDLKNGRRLWDTKKYSERFIVEAEKRGLSCDVFQETAISTKRASGKETRVQNNKDAKVKVSVLYEHYYSFDPYECAFKATYDMLGLDSSSKDITFYFSPDEQKYLADLKLIDKDSFLNTFSNNLKFEPIEGSICKPKDLQNNINFEQLLDGNLEILGLELVLTNSEPGSSSEPDASVSANEENGIDLLDFLNKQEKPEQFDQNPVEKSQLDQQLNEAVAAQQAAEEALRFKNQELKNSDAKLLKAQRKSDLLNQQVLSLRQELAEIEELLAISQEKSTESDAQLQNLGNRLNAALARAASEQRRRLKLEEAERQRLEAEKTTIDNERKRLEALANDLQNDKVRWSAREKVINKQLRELRKSLEEALTRAAMEQAKRLKLEQQLVD